jgi:hypothetical protein
VGITGVGLDVLGSEGATVDGVAGDTSAEPVGWGAVGGVGVLEALGSVAVGETTAEPGGPGTTVVGVVPDGATLGCGPLGTAGPVGVASVSTDAAPGAGGDAGSFCEQARASNAVNVAALDAWALRRIIAPHFPKTRSWPRAWGYGNDTEEARHRGFAPAAHKPIDRCAWSGKIRPAPAE